MNAFYDEIQGQPDALRTAINFYANGSGAERLQRIKRPQRVLLTGMGASYHAALYAEYLFQSIGIDADAVEATDLLNFGAYRLKPIDLVMFISQSGTSGEIRPFLERLAPSQTLVGITNNLDSLLGQNATVVLPQHAGNETTVASKTYINSLAILWMLAQTWSAKPQTPALLLDAVNEINQLIRDESILTAWRNLLDNANPLLFLGHGMHGITARQCAMMLAEWAKHPAIQSGIGAFRHGLIEMVDDKTGAVVFGAAGSTYKSTRALINELESYGASVLPIVAGRPHRTPFELVAHPLGGNDFLTPLLDTVAVQRFVEWTARTSGIPLGFRHIRKVVTQL